MYFVLFSPVRLLGLSCLQSHLAPIGTTCGGCPCLNEPRRRQCAVGWYGQRGCSSWGLIKGKGSCCALCYRDRALREEWVAGWPWQVSKCGWSHDTTEPRRRKRHRSGLGMQRASSQSVMVFEFWTEKMLCKQQRRDWPQIEAAADLISTSSDLAAF